MCGATRCASACCCSWLTLESNVVSGLLARVCVWCVGACSESAALETVVFDFYKTCLKCFWRCVHFLLHHPLVHEKQSFLLGVTTIRAIPSEDAH